MKGLPTGLPGGVKSPFHCIYYTMGIVRVGENSLWIVISSSGVPEVNEGMLGGATPYLDDNLVHSQIFEDHLNALRRVLQRYKSHRVKLTPRKCELFKNQVTFLRRLVTKDGHTMDPADISPVQALKQRNPTTIGEVRKLLGFIS